MIETGPRDEPWRAIRWRGSHRLSGERNFAEWVAEPKPTGFLGINTDFVGHRYRLNDTCRSLDTDKSDTGAATLDGSKRRRLLHSAGQYKRQGVISED